VEIEAVNGFTEEVDLNNRGVHLVDDLGNGYNFVDPEQNSALAVPPGGTLTGILTFLGELDQKATSLRLLVNTYEPQDTVDVASEYNKATAPTVSSEVSVTGEAVASSSEVRVGEILTERKAGSAPEGTVITLPERVLFDFRRS